MEFRILGPLEVAEGDRQVPVSGAKERALLAILLIHTGEVVSADRLIDELWGSDLPANPSNALQVVVSRLRRALQGELVVTRQPGYLLDIGPEQLDARRFEGLVAEARQLAAIDRSRASSLLGEHSACGAAQRWPSSRSSTSPRRRSPGSRRPASRPSS